MKITEATPISIGLTILILGGATWISGIYYTGTSNAEAVRDIKKEFKAKMHNDQEFRERVIDDLSKIKERLHIP